MTFPMAAPPFDAFCPRNDQVALWAHGRSDSCCEIRRASSARHRFLRAFGLARNSESPLVMPASMGDLAMPCPGLFTHSVSALASAAIFLRVRDGPGYAMLRLSRRAGRSPAAH